MPYQALISPGELAPHLGDPQWVVFDCRHQLSDKAYGQRAYAEGHIPDARFADMDETLAGPVTPGSGRHPLPDLEAFARWLGTQGVGDRTQVVAYDDNTGAMAARLWWMLRFVGHPDVAVLDGGWARWTREGQPADRGTPVPRPARFTPHQHALQQVSLDQLLRLYGRSSVLLVDARGAERFEGKSEPIDPVAGHIPGAVNHPFMGNLDPDGKFLSPEELRKRLLATFEGIPPEDTIHYCGSGVSACHNLLAMAAAGLPVGRLYVGSWSQWCADKGRPIETGPSTRRPPPE
jgi:thiosulfate/3-mercaptopyruvate sulfurtransferase